MRAIKFRGKCAKDSRYKGEWVYGGLLQCEKSKDVLIVYSITDTCSCTYHVDPATVGQFTSLYDKHHNEIYEGDILKAGNIGLLEVRFVRGVFAFLWNGNLDDEYPTGSPTHEWAEVIGNIHDNPELLKGGE